MGKVIAVCKSDSKGIPKTDVRSANFKAGFGIEGDAHGGDWHRQVSLLSAERIEEFNKKGADVKPGAFGENLVVSGFDFKSLPVGTLLKCNSALLEITQIGKECHNHCAIYKRMGDCIMPREGTFARVLESGKISVGDEIVIVERTEPRPWQAAVITLSDKGSKGTRTDESGPAIARRLQECGYEIAEQIILPDERERLEKQLVRLSDQRQVNLILTTGGTGFSPRDVTPEATLAVADKVAPGIAEAVRAASLKITPRAMFSRAVAAIRKNTLIINLPGSPKACMESMDVFMETLPHALGLLVDEVHDCAR